MFFFLSEQEVCDWGRICTVLLTNRIKPPNESCETEETEEATSGGHFLSVVGVSPMTSS